MIRVNLLPVKAARREEMQRRQLLILGGVLAVTAAVCFVFHQFRGGAIRELQQDNARIGAEIDALKKEVGDFDKLKAERERLVAQADVIKKLEEGRSGPVYLLRELARVLGPQPTTPPDYEEQCRVDPNACYNPRWDGRRVAIDDFHESAKALSLTGLAKDNADVAEFLKRLQISTYFEGVRLAGTSSVDAAKGGVKHVTFRLSATVNY